MYSNAQYIDMNGEHVSIRVDINGVTSFVPLDAANTDYGAIQELIASGDLVIALPEVTPNETQ